MIAQDTLFYNKRSLDTGVKKIDLSTPIIMGILNATPDSFYDGGRYNSQKKIIEHTKKMINDGADIIDIGGYSTRPGAKDTEEKEETKRLIPVIKLLRKEFPKIVLSADTFRSVIAERSIEAGANIINDISGGTMDNKMFKTASRLKVPYILTHIKGTPQTMKEKANYKNVVKEVKEYFQKKVTELNSLGVKQIILDPGLGFAKELDHNYELVKHLPSFLSFKLPILIGCSRKSMINKILKIKPENALNGTTVVNTISLMNGANILRVHDVKEAKEAIKIVNFYKSLDQK
jgi:dihydropteroate synthase